MSELKKLVESKEDLTMLELAIWWVQDDGTKEALMLAEDAVHELRYLQACAAEWEAFARMEGTDATKVVFMMQTVKKLAKLKRTK